MSIITLTTDLGTKDHYLASLKAAIYSQSEDVKIIDITHEIDQFNILEAGLTVKNCFKDFPQNTIHIIAIDDELSIDNDHVAVYAHGQYFIAADNGLFSIILNDFKPDKIVSLNINQKTDFLTFASRDIFATAACHIARGGTLEIIGKEVNDFRIKKQTLSPVTDSNMIKGIVTNIDNYGNAITNINTSVFEKIRRSRNFSIVFGREDEQIKKISNKYKDVEIAEKLAIFNSNNLLQISINQGNANSLLGLKFYDTIRIEFLWKH